MSHSISGCPVWTAVNNVPAQYEWLAKDENCEVAIIGAGVTGAMCAEKFAHEGVDTILLDTGTVGGSQTSISFGTLQYDGGTTMVELTKKYGCDEAAEIFSLYASAINNIEKMSGDLSCDVGFVRRNSIYYTNEEAFGSSMRREFLVRKHNNFDVKFLKENLNTEQFSFNMKAGIYSNGLAAEVDPYRFTHELVKKAVSEGVRVYENSRIESIMRENNSLVLYSNTHYKITAKKVIIASGMEASKFVGGFCRGRNVSFSVATKPVSEFSGWQGREILFSDDCKNLFVRTTQDNRIIISCVEKGLIDQNGKLGGIIAFPQYLCSKYSSLEETLKTMFPAIRNIKSEYRYAGSYMTVPDGLPIIGEHPDYPNFYFAMCTGSNGIVFAEIASRLLLTLYSGRGTLEILHFRPDR